MAEESYAQKIEGKISDQEKSNKYCYYYWVALGVVVLWILGGTLAVNLLWIIDRAPRTLLTLVLIIFIIIVLSLMAYLAIRLLHKRMVEKEQETKRWRTKLLDAYGSLLETEVKNEKKTMEKEGKENKDRTIPDLENTIKIGDLMLKIKECDSKFKVDVAFDEWFDKNKESVFEDFRNILTRADSKDIASEKTNTSKDEKQAD